MNLLLLISGQCHDLFGKSCKPSHLNTKTSARRAGLYLVEKYERVFVFNRANVDIDDAVTCCWKCGQFKVMGCKECQAPIILRQ